MRSLQGALVYVCLVFGSGFALGLVRVAFLVPRLGERSAELLEMPLMALVMVLAARFVVRHHLQGTPRASLLACGGIALALMITAEAAVGLWLQHRSLAEIVRGHDPISGSVHLALLLLYALLPLLFAERSRPQAGPWSGRPARGSLMAPEPEPPPEGAASAPAPPPGWP